MSKPIKIAKAIKIHMPNVKDTIINNQQREIQNLREMLHRGEKRDAECASASPSPSRLNPSGGYVSSAGAGACPPPVARPTISDAANRVHDSLDKLHSLLDTLSDKLTSVSTPYPKEAGNATGTSPTSCQHLSCLESLNDRTTLATRKVLATLEALMI